MTYIPMIGSGSRLGLTQGGVLRVDGKDFMGAIPTLGKDIYVDSVTGQSTSDGLTPDRAIATLDAAFLQCTADKGYQIFVLPLHAETVTGTIAHDVAGVSVYGLGRGGQRPKFLMDAGTATYAITADDAKVSNLIMNSGHSDSTTCFDVQAATDAWIDRIQFTNNATNENWLTCIKAGTASSNNLCDGLRVTNCKWLQVDAGSLEFIEITEDLDHLWVTDNHVQHEGTGVGSLITMITGDDLNYAYIARNFVRTKDTADVVGILTTDVTDCTGIIVDNLVGSLDTSGEVIATGENSGMYAFRNWTTSVVTASGYELPGVDS